MENMGLKKQIKEDISYYQNNFPNVTNIQKDEWAFNFWILDKIFNIDEELIEDNIIDYNDLGIDCFVFYEESKELYLIQNKYYDSGTCLDPSYLKNDFLLKGINALKNNTYCRSQELQDIYNKYKNNKDFSIYMKLYITNNNVSESCYDIIKKFNCNNENLNSNINAEIISLEELSSLYYGEPINDEQFLSVNIETVNKGTILNLKPKDYNLNTLLEAKYVYTPVISIYRIYREALEKKYPIFDENIREYLGNKKINKKIKDTLLNENDRNNFFYYNNGITIICKDIGKIKVKQNDSNLSSYFSITNPQIVNGCQTVNSIYEVLKNIELTKLEQEYKDCFVMVKVLQIDDANKQKELYKNIVTYNNSQNAIDEKTFVANNNIFKRLQKEFEKKGFLLLIKQSDEYKYLELYKKPTLLLDRNKELLETFGIEITKTKQLTIKLEKLLQVILAFHSGGCDAYIKKSSLLKDNSMQHDIVKSFIKDENVTVDSLILLYLLYLKAEISKKESQDGRTPIPYYLIDGFALYDCNNRCVNNITQILKDKKNIEKILHVYKMTIVMYTKTYETKHNIDYNKMIKKTIDYDLFKTCYEAACCGCTSF